MKKVMAIFILLFLYTPVNAEPTKTIRYLMNEPVSMLDWGLKNLRNILDTHSKIWWKIIPITQWDNNNKKTGLPHAWVAYDWDSNRIKITVQYHFIINSEKELPTLKKQAKEVINKIKSGLFDIDLSTGKPRGNYRWSYFRHSGYSNNQQEEKNLSNELDKITDITLDILQVQANSNGTYNMNPNPPIIQYFTPLLGTDMFYKEGELK